MVAQNFITTIALTLLLGANANPLFRRSQENGRGNIGKVIKDESFNMETENFGNSMNNGVGNVAKTLAAAAGVDNHVLARRSQGNSQGNIGSVVRDESVNFQSKNFGDSVNNGFFNVFGTAAAASGVSNGVLARRSQVNSQGNIGSVSRDESFNFISKNFGDSLNNGVENLASSTNDQQGVGNRLWRRSQGNSQGNIGSVVRDESFNFQSTNFGDSVNNGVGNVFETVAAASGVGNSAFARRSQGNSQGNIGSVVRDESFNFQSTNFGDSVNNGVGNVFETVASASGVGNGAFARRSQGNSQGNIGSVARDESSNFKSENFGDSANVGFLNTLSTVASAAGVDNQLSRRAQIHNQGSIGSVENDKSKIFAMISQESAGLGNAPDSSTEKPVVADFIDVTKVTSVPIEKRSIVNKDSSNNAVTNDRSFKHLGITENASTNQAAQGVARPLSWWKRSISNNNKSVNDVLNDNSFKSATFTENDSVNQASLGVLGHPFFAKRSIINEDASTNSVRNDHSIKILESLENASVNQALTDRI